MDESLAEAHHALALHKTWGEWDWPSAERAFERAIELNPNYAEARAYYSDFLSIMGRSDEAMDQIGRALELDPLNSLYQALYGTRLLEVRGYDDAIAQFRKALRTNPNLWFALALVSHSLHLKGMYEEALAAHTSFLATIGDRGGEEALTRGYEEGGYVGAMRRLAETEAARSRRTHTFATAVADAYLRAGENDLALEWHERAFADRDPILLYLGVDPLNDVVRDDPRFQDLLRRMNFPE